MDFGTLLHVAKKNSEADKNACKYYNTKFAPPKKESKDKKLSENIQKFLRKREEEEKERQRIEREKLANLLSKRDEKSKNKIKKMLKVTKSANKSVLDDAVNSEHTAITMQGPEQPDQDDYGYVSTEANAFYQKYIEKVKDIKEDKGFAPSRPQSLKDLTGTKERVKAAITKEIEEKKNHTRQRTSTTSANSATSAASTTATKETNASVSRSSSKTLYDPEAERREEERKKRDEEQKKAKNRKPAPPPMDFQALLKLAEKKQHEPIEIVVEVKKKEPERLLTSKEKRELEERQREREARERRKRHSNENTPKDCSKSVEQVERNKDHNSGRMEPNGRIPKLNQTVKVPVGAQMSKTGNKSSSSANSSDGLKKINGISSSNVTSSVFNAQASKPSTSSTCTSKVALKSNTPQSNTLTKKPVMAVKSSTTLSGTSSSNSISFGTSRAPQASNSLLKTVSGVAVRDFPPRDIKTAKPRQFPPTDLEKTRQFPPPDVRRGGGSKSNECRKPQMAQKRRILDDDDEDEYDSELDDFIDDGDCEDDYSSHIKEIFGYDKSRYRDIDDEDDAAMESNFAQVQREEYISKKIGIKEDLEDMKMEAAEKKRKMMMKKRHH